MAHILSNEKDIKDALLAGQVGVIPTDTVYGLVARAGDTAAVARLYELKDRMAKPGTLVGASVEQFVDLGITRRYLVPVANYWPNSISVVVPVLEEQLAYLHMGVHSLAVRIPNNEKLLRLLQQTGPLLTSSANAPGEPTAGTLAEAQAYFQDRVDFYVDGGDLHDHAPSTVVRVVDDAVEVLRQGAAKIEE